MEVIDVTNLDRVFSIWKDLEASYKKKGKGSKKDFLMALAGSETKIIKTRQMIMKDFVNTEENISRLDSLMATMKDTCTKLTSVDTIKNLNKFVWGDLLITPEDYEITCETISQLPIKDFHEAIANHEYATVFSSAGNFQVPNTEGFLHFETEQELVSWFDEIHTLDGCSDFVKQAYFMIINRLTTQTLSIPLSIVSKDAIPFHYKASEKINKKMQTPKGIKFMAAADVKADVFCDENSVRKETVIAVYGR